MVRRELDRLVSQHYTNWLTISPIPPPAIISDFMTSCVVVGLTPNFSNPHEHLVGNNSIWSPHLRGATCDRWNAFRINLIHHHLLTRIDTPVSDNKLQYKLFRGCAVILVLVLVATSRTNLWPWGEQLWRTAGSLTRRGGVIERLKSEIRCRQHSLVIDYRWQCIKRKWISVGFLNRWWVGGWCEGASKSQWNKKFGE